MCVVCGGAVHHISVILSQHVNVEHVLIELEGHVLGGSDGLKLSLKKKKKGGGGG